MIEIKLIKTNNGCYINTEDTRYYVDVMSLYFDGEKAEKTFCKGWYFIKQYPKKVQKKCEGERYNKRYEIKDKENITKKFPEIIPYRKSREYNEDVLCELYTLCFDLEPDYFEDLDFKIDTICEIAELSEYTPISYEAVQQSGWTNRKYTITNKDVEHQLIDKILFPEMLLYDLPAKFTSRQVYNITRQFIKDNIDRKYAEITSDYDFCFKVRKRGITVFEMTAKDDSYKGYTPIEGLTAKSDKALKEKMDKWLERIIKHINDPVEICPHCKGTGYLGDMKKIDINKVLKNK